MDTDIVLPTGEKIDIRRVYRKRYTLRRSGSGGISTTVPKMAMEREARVRGLTVEEFIEQYDIEWLFNHFSGYYIQIVPKRD